MTKQSSYITIAVNFSDLEDIEFHLVVNDHTDYPLLVNKRGCYFEAFLTQYADTPGVNEVLKIFAKIQLWFNHTISDDKSHYPLLSFISEFKVRGYSTVYHFCSSVDSSNIAKSIDTKGYAMANDSLSVVKEILKLKKL